ncbi:unnamed protein product [Rotaria socialis]|uniref:Cation/H+ exchanger transmembrane domain-containing protein n=1 Tax=Rotaria socialis TaxID=392032 RepID=A0A821UMX1_9BILA|nr:unnamed protein product [Rotaria socialis]CAF4892773.1 unnamed protein product [Rotaria socialis]
MVTLFENPHESPLAMFLLQVFITLIVCKILAKLLSFIRQPQVIGQIIAGIIFGPSILGYAEGWTEAIWPTSSLKIFQLIANLGLIFFMFFLGLELDLQQIKANWKVTIPVACVSIIFPVGIGCAVALWFYQMNEGIETSKTAFILFIASGFGFSAFPVLATLLNSMNLLSEPIGIQTISLAAVEDIVVWVVLAVASAFSSGGSALQGLYTLLLTLAFILIMFIVIRPIFGWAHGYYLRRENDCNVYIVVGCFLLLLIASFTTEVMGIHAFFGAFIAGLCIPRKGELVEFLSIRIELIIVEFFLPLYFANSGLKTKLNLLNTGRSWWTLLILIILASVAKVIPVTLATKLCTRKPWNYCASMGVLMNTRGIVQLVVLNIGVQLKVISPVIFAMFVLMATVLTFITSPILYLLYQRNAASKLIEESNAANDLSMTAQGENNVEKAKEDITVITVAENGVISPSELSTGQVIINTRNASSQSLHNHLAHRHSSSRIMYDADGNRWELRAHESPRRPSHMTLF